MLGSVYVWNVKKGGDRPWFSALQRILTRMPFTHSSLGLGQVKGGEAQLEAKECVTVTPLIFDISGDVDVVSFSVNLPEKTLDLIVTYMYKKYSGDIYGFGQLLYFVYRYINETFGRDVRKKKNWFPKGDICSEILYFYFRELAEVTNNAALTAKLNEWNSNTFHSGDVYTVCSLFPPLFRRNA